MSGVVGRDKQERAAATSTRGTPSRATLYAYALWAAEQLPAKRPPPVACTRYGAARDERSGVRRHACASQIPWRCSAARAAAAALAASRAALPQPRRQSRAPACACGCGKGRETSGDVLIHAASRTARGKGYSKGAPRVSAPRGPGQEPRSPHTPRTRHVCACVCACCARCLRARALVRACACACVRARARACVRLRTSAGSSGQTRMAPPHDASLRKSGRRRGCMSGLCLGKRKTPGLRKEENTDASFACPGCASPAAAASARAHNRAGTSRPTAPA